MNDRSLSQQYPIMSMLIPNNLIQEELDGLYGSTVLAEMQEILANYKIYDLGAEFELSKSEDMTPAELKFQLAKQIIDKEARFMFSKKPDVVFSSRRDGTVDNDVIAKCQDFVNDVLKRNSFSRKLVQAAKDCFIGKRVAYVVNFNEKGISVQFVPSFGFVYDTDPEDVDRITKLVVFYITQDSKEKRNQVIYRKRYWLDENDGMCWIQEATFDGMGKLLEEITPEAKLLFDYIPGGVILNDGLTGDVLGTSEIAYLHNSESWFSRLSSNDIDAMRLSMNPIKYAMDVDPATTKGLSAAAGSFWDLASNTDSPNESTAGKVGVLETSMAYSPALEKTLARIRTGMLDSVDMPDIKDLALKVTSGKALKAIYWGLVVRSDEKMLSWKTAIEKIALTIIEGALKYPLSITRYDFSLDGVDPLNMKVDVDNQYPLPEDEAEEKTVDLAEVTAEVMSKKSYMKKWRGLTDEDADNEIEQIAKERETLDKGMFSGGKNPFGDQVKKTVPGQEEEVPEEEDPEEDPEDPEADPNAKKDPFKKGKEMSDKGGKK